MLLGCHAVAHLLAGWLSPKADAWMRSLKGMRPAQLRFLLVFARRLRMIFFVILVWILAAIMLEVTWPSRSYLIVLVANLTTAWLVIAIASRLIRNRLLRKVVQWTALIVATIAILNLRGEIEMLLDSISFSFGSVRLTALLVLQGIVTLALLMLLANWLSKLVHRRLQGVGDMSPSMKVLTEKLVALALYVTAFFIAMGAIGFDLTTLTFLSGAVALGIGLGLQKVVSNLLSGLILLVDKSIKPGDVISLGETFGWISSLGARYVSVVTRDGREFLIPNEDLITGQVVNWTHSDDNVRLDIYFGVSYASDPHQVRVLAREAAATVGRVVSRPAPVCHIVGFGDSSIDFILRFWIRDPAQGLTNVRGDVYLALWDALKRDGVEIPFPRRDVHVFPEGAQAQPSGIVD
ncbi:mechanosensitive ion channel [Rhodobacteraceae bacterium KN286]|uniref:Mechanosensitive ion channel n=2 Tax=Oceanomicrobium pacificus TaxID=2692916 RepID=A0A6B0TU95_9RHOB|nr:mechanosensitive ion channel [Oceanomicrobium pacificus]